MVGATHILQKCKWILKKVKSCYWRTTHKYDINLTATAFSCRGIVDQQGNQHEAVA